MVRRGIQADRNGLFHPYTGKASELAVISSLCCAGRRCPSYTSKFVGSASFQQKLLHLAHGAHRQRACKQKLCWVLLLCQRGQAQLLQFAFQLRRVESFELGGDKPCHDMFAIKCVGHADDRRSFHKRVTVLDILNPARADGPFLIIENAQLKSKRFLGKLYATWVFIL